MHLFTKNFWRISAFYSIGLTISTELIMAGAAYDRITGCEGDCFVIPLYAGFILGTIIFFLYLATLIDYCVNKKTFPLLKHKAWTGFILLFILSFLSTAYFLNRWSLF